MGLTSQAKKQPVLASIAVFLFLVAISTLLTTYFVFSRKPKFPNPVRGSFTGTGSPILTDEEKQTIITKAKMLREKWKVWAFAHRRDLARLKTASDVAVAFEVYNLIPAKPSQEETGLDNNDLSQPPFYFTWIAFSKTSRLPDKFKGDKKATKNFNNEKFYRDKAIVDGFKLHRDIPISSSINFGRINYTLWASGRLTENVGPEPGSKNGWQSREIEPAFNLSSQEGQKR